MKSGVAAMDLADPPGAKKCDPNHVSPLELPGSADFGPRCVFPNCPRQPVRPTAW